LRSQTIYGSQVETLGPYSPNYTQEVTYDNYSYSN